MSTLPAGALAVEVAGETVVLLPERALWIPAHHVVVVADLHWGKAATFRAARAGPYGNHGPRSHQALEGAL